MPNEKKCVLLNNATVSLRLEYGDSSEACQASVTVSCAYTNYESALMFVKGADQGALES